jgi:hypothetical protein
MLLVQFLFKMDQIDSTHQGFLWRDESGPTTQLIVTFFITVVKKMPAPMPRSTQIFSFSNRSTVIEAAT